MAESKPTPMESVYAAFDWAREKAEPYLTWLPDEIEPYAVDAVTIVLLSLALVGLWKKGAELWRVVIWAPRTLWRRAAGYKPPKSEAAAATEAAQRTVQISEEILRAVLSTQAAKAEESGASLPEDAIERAVAASREVLSSNDPSKADAQEALRAGDLRAAEDALAEAFDREAEAATRIGDEATQLKAKAARTAREKATLAATRSVAEALLWYGRAAELEPEAFSTRIELARFHQAVGDLGAAMDAARAALRVAPSDRERSVALNDLGDVQVAQGDLGKALESFQASHAIFEHLAGADASNTGLQRDLSVLHERIGDLHEVRGDVAAAIESYEASLVIAGSLADGFPDHPQFPSDLVITNRRLAELRDERE